jgi:hypothetical protein
LLTFNDGNKYILQRINEVFDIEKVMKNISLVQEHLTNKKKLGTFSAEYDILKTQKTLD